MDGILGVTKCVLGVMRRKVAHITHLTERIFYMKSNRYYYFKVLRTGNNYEGGIRGLNVQNSDVHRGSTTVFTQLFPIFDMFFRITPVQQQPSL
jgi:hypothetical protein